MIYSAIVSITTHNALHIIAVRIAHCQYSLLWSQQLHANV